MTCEEFSLVVQEVVDNLKEVLDKKGAEYSPGTDRLSNFKYAAVLNHCTYAQALWGFVTKHIIALGDFIHEPDRVTKEQWNEKITDIINYMILLKALLREEDRV